MANSPIKVDYDRAKFDYMAQKSIHVYADRRENYSGTCLVEEGQPIPEYYVRVIDREKFASSCYYYSTQEFHTPPKDTALNNINTEFFTHYYAISGATVRHALLKGIGTYIGYRNGLKQKLLSFFKTNGKTHEERVAIFNKISLSDASLDYLSITDVHDIMTQMGSTHEQLCEFYPQYIQKRQFQLKKPQYYEPVQAFLEQFHHRNLEELAVYFPYLENMALNYKPDTLPDIFDDRHPITTAVTFSYRKLMRLYPMEKWSEKNYLDVVKKLCSAMSKKYKIDKFQACFTDKHRGTAIAVLEHNTPEMDNDKFQRVFAAFFLSLSRLELCAKDASSADVTEDIVGTWLLKHDIEKLLSGVPAQEKKVLRKAKI